MFDWDKKVYFVQDLEISKNGMRRGERERERERKREREKERERERHRERDISLIDR